MLLAFIAICLIIAGIVRLHVDPTIGNQPANPEPANAAG
jgi:hypothetical protein